MSSSVSPSSSQSSQSTSQAVPTAHVPTEGLISPDRVPVRRALVSVYDKTGLVPLAQALDRRRLLKSVRNALSRPRGPPEGIGGSPEGNGLKNPFELLDSIDDAGLGHRARRADEQRLAGKPLEGFCAARTESRSLSGGYDDGGDSH